MTLHLYDPEAGRPEPGWWARARDLREQRLTYDQIAERLGKSFDGVRYALCPSIRAVHHAKRRRQPSSQGRAR